MDALYQLFQQAPELGSLIDPSTVAGGGLFDARWDELAGLLEAALGAEGDGSEAGAEQREAAIAAKGMAVAVRLLSQRYEWVVTNPPYLKAADHGSLLKVFCEKNYPNASGDIANVFLDRSFLVCKAEGVVQFVMPQNWLFLGGYKNQRIDLLRNSTWNLLGRLGEKGFESNAAAGAFTILVTLTRAKPSAETNFTEIDARIFKTPKEKAVALTETHLNLINQIKQISNPDHRIVVGDTTEIPLLENFATSYQGITTGDNQRFIIKHWEVILGGSGWKTLQSTGDHTEYYSGREHVFLWDNGNGVVAKSDKARIQGKIAWGKNAVSVRQMRKLPATINSGSAWDMNCATIVPKNALHLAAIWSFCSSPEFNIAVRKIDQKINVTNATLAKVPFDLDYWQQVSMADYPQGLPKPYSNLISNDPQQGAN